MSISQIYTLSLHDALPILDQQKYAKRPRVSRQNTAATKRDISAWYREDWRKKVERVGNLNYPDEARRQGIYGSLRVLRSEEHTSELQSRFDLVCRLLLEKK